MKNIFYIYIYVIKSKESHQPHSLYYKKIMVYKLYSLNYFNAFRRKDLQ